MILERTFDIDKINSVLKHPDIWPSVSDEGSDIETFEPPMGDNHYLFDEGVLFILHPYDEDWEIHANVLPDYRNKAKEAAEETLEYGFIELKADRIIARIPEKYGNVYGFALKFMKDEGYIDDKHYLTLRIEEWVLCRVLKH